MTILLIFSWNKKVKILCEILKLQSQMDISTDAIKGASPENTKSNEDSGTETMEVDDNKSDDSAPVKLERKEAEKRKRTSSR